MDIAQFFTFGLDTAQALPATYQPSLVVVSYLIAALAGYAFLHFTARIADLHDSAVRFAWMAGGALTMGLGVWAMHFVGMLAYRLPIPVGYDPWITGLSAAPAVLASGVALHVVAKPPVTIPRLLIGGTVMGAGIGTMHYTGMAAMSLDAFVRYDPVLFATSIVVAVVLAIGALAATFWTVRPGKSGATLTREAIGALIMGLAVSGMHYTAMTSTLCFAAEGRSRGVLALDHQVFATATTVVATLVLLLAIAGVMFDRRLSVEIQQRRQAAASAQRIGQRLMDAIETMPDGLAVFDKDDGLVLCNSRYREDFAAIARLLAPGTRFEDILRGWIATQWPDESPEQREERIAERMRQHRDPGEPVVQVSPGGKWSLIRERRTADGGSVIVRTDITAVKEADERLRERDAQLRQAQKMEAVGRLTGGVAHDFNNILQVILGGSQILARRLPADDEPIQRQIQMIKRAADRAADLTRRLLAFSRQQPLVPQALDLGELASGLVPMFKRTLPESIAISLVTSRRPPIVVADAGMLESALLNLVVNARDAMPDGGALMIEVDTVTVAAESVGAARFRDVAPGRYGMVAVKDDGCGMTPDVLERAFEPFFTTKPVGKGTGIGLSTTYGFVKQSGGHITIESAPGHGTSVHLFLPLGEAQAAAAKPATEDALPTGRELVLLVEDDVSLRVQTEEFMRELGYTVLSAADGPSALARLKATPGIELLFTDLIMPGGLHGKELAHQARALNPSLKILFASGYADSALGPRIPGTQLLFKPYSLEKLAATLRNVLDGPAPPPA